MNGVIKKKVEDRGFGFITQEGEKTDLFFHSKDVVGTTFEQLREGDSVTFDVGPGKGDKPAALNVSKAE